MVLKTQYWLTSKQTRIADRFASTKTVLHHKTATYRYHNHRRYPNRPNHHHYRRRPNHHRHWL